MVCVVRSERNEGEGILSQVSLNLTGQQAEFLRMFLTMAIYQMKEHCSVKEAEDPAVNVTFSTLGAIIAQIPMSEGVL